MNNTKNNLELNNNNDNNCDIIWEVQWIEAQWNELCLYVYLTYPHDLWQMKQNPNHCCLSCFWGYTLHIQPSLVIHTAWWEMFCPVKVRELLAQLEHWKSVCSPHTSQNPYNRGWPSLYRYIALWICLSSQYSELSKRLQEAWKQCAECFVQNSAPSLLLEFLLRNSKKKPWKL